MSFDRDLASNIYAIAGTSDDGAAASGTIRFSANPSADDTITLNGTAITFKASGATGNQVNIGLALSDTLTALKTFLDGSANAQLVKCTYAVTANSLVVTFKTVGTAGNSYTLAASAATVSGSTLVGGLNIESASEAYTAVVDSDTYAGWKSCTFVAFNETAVAYSAASWDVEDSPNNSDWSNVDSSLLINPLPADTSTTAKVFQIGYVGKQRYVRAAFSSGSVPWQVLVILGHPSEAPLFQSDVAGIEG